MDTQLPQPPQPKSTNLPGDNGNRQQQPEVNSIVGSAVGVKEREAEPSFSKNEKLPITDRSVEIKYPPEVVKSGVKPRPISHPVPPQLSHAGVKPLGDNVTIGNGSTVSLPLTEDQIRIGMKRNVSSSIRWLAEWCLRKIKMIQIRLGQSKVNQQTS